MISIGYVAAIVATVVCLLIGIAIIVFGRLDDDLGRLWQGLGTVWIIGTLAITTWGLWPPFDMQYHRYKPVNGTIDVIQPRMLADGNGGTSQMFAVRLREDGNTYRCDDSRCSLLKSGDRLWLRCIREWQYAAESGWKCNYVRSETAD